MNLAWAAKTALGRVDGGDWSSIFGEVETVSPATEEAALRAVAATIVAPARPYYDGAQ